MLNLGGNNDFSRKPRALCCYICGREYGTNSLSIHLPQCQEIWIKREALKPKGERRPLPPPPRGMTNVGGKMSAKDMDNYNQSAFDNYNTVALVGCAHCGRTFDPDRLKIHNKSCTADNPARKIGTARLSQKTTSAASPDRVVTTKGRDSSSSREHNGSNMNGSMFNSEDYMSSTSKGHIHQNSQNPENTNGGVTKRGVSFANDIDSSDTPINRLPTSGAPLKKPSISAYTMKEEFETEEEPDTTLVPCDKCGRKFTEDRVGKHMSICKGNNSLKKKHDPVASAPKNKSRTDKNAAWRHKHYEFQESIAYAKQMNAVQSRGGNIVKELPPPPPALNPDYIMCHTCGRRFSPSAAERHIPLCGGIMNKPKSLVRTSTSSLAISRGQAPALAHAHNAYSTATYIGGGNQHPQQSNMISPTRMAGKNVLGNTMSNNNNNNNNRMKSPTRSTASMNTTTTNNNNTLQRTSTIGNNHRMTSPTRSNPNNTSTPQRQATTAQRNTSNHNIPTNTNNTRGIPARTATASIARFCTECGAERVSAGRFCHQCGKQH